MARCIAYFNLTNPLAPFTKVIGVSLAPHLLSPLFSQDSDFRISSGMILSETPVISFSIETKVVAGIHYWRL